MVGLLEAPGAHRHPSGSRQAAGVAATAAQLPGEAEAAEGRHDAAAEAARAGAAVARHAPVVLNDPLVGMGRPLGLGIARWRLLRLLRGVSRVRVRIPRGWLWRVACRVGGVGRVACKGVGMTR